MVLGRADIPLEIIGQICRKYRVRELSVFGSVLRTDFNIESDIDLLVDFQPNHGLGFIEYLQCQDELSGVFGRRIDLVQKAGLKHALRDEILRSRRVIYAN